MNPRLNDRQLLEVLSVLDAASDATEVITAALNEGNTPKAVAAAMVTADLVERVRDMLADEANP
jgi:hypothetical protein